jgi:hypothetical protein
MPSNPKIIQIASLPAGDRSPPAFAVLRDDGSVLIYRPRITHGGITIDDGGWHRLPAIPEGM